jgi:hypothetical protein
MKIVSGDRFWIRRAIAGRNMKIYALFDTKFGRIRSFFVYQWLKFCRFKRESRATLRPLAGLMGSAGRVFETPAFNSQKWPKSIHLARLPKFVMNTSKNSVVVEITVPNLESSNELKTIGQSEEVRQIKQTMLTLKSVFRSTSHRDLGGRFHQHFRSKKFDAFYGNGN